MTAVLARPRGRATTRPAPRTSIRAGRSPLLTAVMALYLLYTLLPLAWLVISATKTQDALLSSPGLVPAGPFALFDNIAQTVTYDGGVFLRWLGNTLLYVVVGAGSATLLATMAGYGLAKYRFRGRNAVFAVVLAAIAIPGTALAVPTFLLFSSLGLTNTPWAIIIPSMVNPFGMYLVWAYARDAVPDELMEAARLDGAGELRIFLTVTGRLLAPAVVTVGLFAAVSTWNNYFLPLIMLSEPAWYPLTVGLTQWNQQSAGAGARPVFHLVITGVLITIIPLVAAFLLLQRFWRSGLTAGGLKG